MMFTSTLPKRTVDYRFRNILSSFANSARQARLFLESRGFRHVAGFKPGLPSVFRHVSGKAFVTIRKDNLKELHPAFHGKGFLFKLCTPKGKILKVDTNTWEVGR